MKKWGIKYSYICNMACVHDRLKIIFAFYIYVFLLAFVTYTIHYFVPHEHDFYIDWFSKCTGNDENDSFTFCSYVRSEECLSDMSLFH
jgi:hypothetical protein